jgi:pyridoxamine 5'-phosphate oxidase
MPIANLRREFTLATLSEHSADADPISQFNSWLDEARKAGLPDANAMSLATVDGDGKPSIRVLLVKGVDQRGFTWFTNYQSRKGRDLAARPQAALLFYWSALERQVSVEGRVECLSAAESDAYFDTRPRNSRLGALASAQSERIADREALEAQFASVESAYAGGEPKRPDGWGGHRLVPERIEFWQGRGSRLHDRLLYTLQPDGSWERGRLQP